MNQDTKKCHQVCSRIPTSAVPCHSSLGRPCGQTWLTQTTRFDKLASCLSDRRPGDMHTRARHPITPLRNWNIATVQQNATHWVATLLVPSYSFILTPSYYSMPLADWHDLYDKRSKKTRFNSCRYAIYHSRLHNKIKIHAYHR